MSLQTRLEALITALGADMKKASVEQFTWSIYGSLSGTYTGKAKIYCEGNYTFESCRISLGTASSSGAVTVDVNKNGTTIYTTQTARPSIAASGTTAVGNSPAVTSFAAGDYLTVDLDAFGTGAADLTIVVRLRRT